MPNRTTDEQRLLEKAGRYLPGGNTGNLHFNPEQDFLVAGGKGSRVWDVSGNEYVDWLMGSGPMLLGHAHPHVVEAVIKTVEQGSTFFANNDKAVMLAEALVEAVPCADKARFTTSGTDACFQAMRIARAYTGKEKVLKFEGGYHGSSDYALMSVTPSASLEFPQSEANSGGIPKAIADLMLIAPFNDLATTEAIIQAHHEELAAVIVEPLQRIIAPRPGFLQGAARHHHPLRHSPDFRRGSNQLPAGLRRGAGILRRDARPVFRGQNYGRRLSVGRSAGPRRNHVGLRPG